VGAQSWSTSSPNLDDTRLTPKMVDRKMERRPVSLIDFLPASVAWADSITMSSENCICQEQDFPYDPCNRLPAQAQPYALIV
jgi:hypothetical protein